MELPLQVSLTPEQLAAIRAGDGLARFVDLENHLTYYVISQPQTPVLDDELDDDYVRGKLAEAAQDSSHGDVADWKIDEIKHELRARISKN